MISEICSARRSPSPSGRGSARRAASPLVALVAALAVVLSACGGSGHDSADTPTTASPPTTATTAAPSTTAPTTTRPTTTTSSTTTTTTPPKPEELTEPPGPLQSGSKGKRTLALQLALKAQSYDPGEPDGQFGLKTTMAVWAWQALHGQTADGIVGPQTEALILAKPAQPMLRPALGPTHTEIDLDRQVILVWKGGKLLLVSHVSSGSQVPYCDKGNCGDAVTPIGTYHYYRRVSGWRDAPLGLLYNPVYFVGGIAVHGATSVPNHPASHGCVRIPMHIAEYFPSLVDKGDTVATFRS